MPKKFTFDEVNSFFVEHGCTLLETHYENSEQKLKFVCKCGREYEKDFEHFRRKPRCPECTYDVLRKKFAHDVEYVRQTYIENGAEWLDGEYKNKRSILTFRCACGQVDSKTFADFKTFPHCTRCNQNATYSIDDVRAIMKDYGATLLEETYTDSRTQMRFICACGAESTKNLNTILSKKHCKCRECAFDHMRNDFDRVKAEFDAEGWTLLSTEYTNSMTKMDCMCDKGHQLSMTYNSFQRGSRCKICYEDARRFDYEYVYSTFEKDGYLLLDETYKSDKKPLHVICPNGHEWTVPFGSFKNGRRCMACFHDNLRIDYDDVKKFVESIGYQLLSSEYINTSSKISVKCQNGHEYDVTFGSLKAGTKCRTCYHEHNRGENHPSWNPNLTKEERERGRRYPEYHQWIGDVKSRDNYRCVCCGSREKLQAHHLYSYASYPSKRLDIENGATLCLQCHKGKHVGFHSRYGFYNNTAEQFYEYKRWRQQQLGIYDVNDVEKEVTESGECMVENVRETTEYAVAN